MVTQLVLGDANVDASDAVRSHVHRRDTPFVVISRTIRDACGDAAFGVASLPHHVALTRAPQNGMTALMFAAGKGCTTTVAALVRLGADINAKNKVRLLKLPAASVRCLPSLLSLSASVVNFRQPN